jgi:hypothetical protein
MVLEFVSWQTHGMLELERTVETFQSNSVTASGETEECSVCPKTFTRVMSIEPFPSLRTKLICYSLVSGHIILTL